MLLSPARPSLAAALVGTSDGEDVVAVAVDAVASADVDVSGDTRVVVTVVSVMPDEMVLTITAHVTLAVRSVVAGVVVVIGSGYEVQLVSEVCVVVVVETTLVVLSSPAAAVAAVVALSAAAAAARSREERILLV